VLVEGGIQNERLSAAINPSLRDDWIRVLVPSDEVLLFSDKSTQKPVAYDLPASRVPSALHNFRRTQNSPLFGRLRHAACFILKLLQCSATSEGGVPLADLQSNLNLGSTQSKYNHYWVTHCY